MRATCNRYGISEQGVTGRANTYLNNLVSRNAHADIQLLNGLIDSGTVRSDPLFADSVRALPLRTFSLSASSPAIGRGMPTFAPAVDIDGDVRGASIDIGAYQY